LIIVGVLAVSKPEATLLASFNAEVILEYLTIDTCVEFTIQMGVQYV